MPHITRRTAALAGLALGPVFLAVVALATVLQRDLLAELGWTFTDHGDVPYPSATATGALGFVQTANFVVGGLLAGVFVLGFRRELRGRVAAPVATAALWGYVAAFLLSTFPTDLGTDMPVTWHGWLHAIAFLLLHLSLLVMLPATWLALRSNPDWAGWRVVGPVLLLVFVVAATGLGLPGDTSWYVWLVLLVAFPALMGGHLLQLSRTGAPGPTAEREDMTPVDRPR